MVIKTEVCSFSEYRIWPGRGTRFVRRDSSLLIQSTRKVASLLVQRKKPAKLVWTQVWRKMNKKGKADEHARRTRRRAGRKARGYTGVSAEAIREKKAANSKEGVKTTAELAAVRAAKRRAKASSRK